MQWYSGTSGYSYKEWKGAFYPQDMSADGMLAYYAERLTAVEINNTFYRMPKSHVLSAWAAVVPAAFRFVIKAPRRITHEKRLSESADVTVMLAQKVDVLEEKLGAVLFQLPPFLRKDMERLNAFLDSLPKTLPSAMEFRHVSWFDDEVMDTLAARGIALCVADDGETPLPDRIATAPWIYLRLRQPAYSDTALQEWIDRCTPLGAQSGYAFFKHEDDATGPALAARFLELASDARRVAKPPRRAEAIRRRARSEKA